MSREPDVIDRLGHLIQLLHEKEKEMFARGPAPLGILRNVKVWQHRDDYYPELPRPNKTERQKRLERLAKQWDVYENAVLRRFFKKWATQTLDQDPDFNNAVVKKIVDAALKRHETQNRTKIEQRSKSKTVKRRKSVQTRSKPKQKRESPQTPEKQAETIEKTKNSIKQTKTETEKPTKKKQKHRKGSKKKQTKVNEKEHSMKVERDAIIRRVSQRLHQEKIMPKLNLKYEPEDGIQEVSLADLTRESTQKSMTRTEVYNNDSECLISQEEEDVIEPVEMTKNEEGTLDDTVKDSEEQGGISPEDHKGSENQEENGQETGNLENEVEERHEEEVVIPLRKGEIVEKEDRNEPNEEEDTIADEEENNETVKEEDGEVVEEEEESEVVLPLRNGEIVEEEDKNEVNEEEDRNAGEEENNEIVNEDGNEVVEGDEEEMVLDENLSNDVEEEISDGEEENTEVMVSTHGEEEDENACF